MENISEKISRILQKEYGLTVQEICRMTTGVGGDTFLAQTSQGKFVYKIADAGVMNHPEEEPALCNFLYKRGIAVSCFLKNRWGSFITPYDEKRISHVQQYVEGKVFSMNTAPEWFMEQAPVLLGRIHRELQPYKELPMGIGSDFFRYMTPENAEKSYRRSYATAKEMGEAELLEDLEFRCKVIPKLSGWKFLLLCGALL